MQRNKNAKNTVLFYKLYRKLALYIGFSPNLINKDFTNYDHLFTDSSLALALCFHVQSKVKI